MVDFESDGWFFFLSEIMFGLEINLNDDRVINEFMIGDFDGRFCYVFILVSSICEIFYFWLEINEVSLLFMS